MQPVTSYEKARTIYWNTPVGITVQETENIEQLRASFYMVQRRDGKRYFKTKIKNGILTLKRIL